MTRRKTPRWRTHAKASFAGGMHVCVQRARPIVVVRAQYRGNQYDQETENEGIHGRTVPE